MASGWAHDGAVQEQIDATVESEVARVRSRLGQTQSLTHCEDCGEEIPAARRHALAGVGQLGAPVRLVAQQAERIHPLQHRRHRRSRLPRHLPVPGG